MSIFTKRAYDSTKERGTSDVGRNLRDTERASAQAYRQFGGTGPAPGLSTRDREDALRDYGISEEQRREQASGQLAGLAQGIDTRTSMVSDAVADAKQLVEDANRNAAQQQINQDRGFSLETRQTQEDTENKLREISFKEYSSQAQRNDAIDEAYEKGALENQLFDMGVEGKIRQQDIDYYYAKMKQDLDNAFKMWEVHFSANSKKYFERVQANASNIGGLISGITEMVVGGVTQ